MPVNLVAHRFGRAQANSVAAKVPLYGRIILPNGIESIACGCAHDGRRYLVPRWSILESNASALSGEKRPSHIKTKIDRNYQGHLLRIRSGVSEMFGAFPGETFYIVGSGPSLIRNGHLLCRSDGRKIIAINAALKYMVQTGEKPDYWFCLDWKSSTSWLEGLDVSGVKLITSVTTPPKMVDRFDQHYHFVGITQSPDCREGVNEKLGYLGGLDCGLTATYSAMYLAWAAGAKRIVLVGQDFAYTFGMYHWNEMVKRGHYKAAEAYPVDCISGGDTVTDRQMAVNMTLVQAAAMWLKMDGVEVVNASQHGIMDWNPRPLAEVLAEDVKEMAHERV